MSVRRRDLELVLARAERAVALLDRCRPLNAATEQQRLFEGWRRGAEPTPRWAYADVTRLAEIRAALEEVAARAIGAEPWGRFYAERAEELAREAAAVEALNTPLFRERAALRFPIDTDRDGQVALRWANAWCSEAPEPEGDAGRSSDDAGDPSSLISAMRRAVGRHRLPFRVVSSANLLSAAATGDGVIVVRAGARYPDCEVKRIVAHEVLGHALPRMRARRESHGLFAVGTAGGSDDEEGRALIIELRAGCLGKHRKAELGRRHLSALAVRAGADWVETVRLLLDLGAPVASAITIAARAHRGGGLGRELVYLTALARVGRALEEDPDVETWMERGRIAVRHVQSLRMLGEPPERIPTRSAA